MKLSSARRTWTFVVLAAVLAAPQADAASVGPTGQFEGLTTIKNCVGPLTSYSCGIDGFSTLCVEYAVLGVLGTPCTVTWGGGVSGVAAVVNNQRVCSASGAGTATVTSTTFPDPGQDFNGTFVVKNGAGTFTGTDSDGNAPDGSTISFAFTAGCAQNMSNVRTAGVYQVLSVV